MKEKIIKKYARMFALNQWEIKALDAFIYEDEAMKRLSVLKVAHTRLGRASKWFRKVGAKKAEISDLLVSLIAEDCKKENFTFIFVK